MRSLTSINDGVKRHGKNTGIDLTTAEGIINSNRILRAQAAQLKWPELRRVNTDLTVTAGNTERNPRETVVNIHCERCQHDRLYSCSERRGIPIEISTYLFDERAERGGIGYNL